MPSTGMVLPMNCSAKAVSSVQRVPMEGVSPMESMVRVAMVPSAFRVTMAITSEAKPRAVPTSAPSGRGSAMVSTAESSADSSSPKEKGTASGFSGAAQAAFTASMTALEVTVAPESTSMLSVEKGAALPTNCWANSASVVARVPKPAVSPMASMFRPVTTPASSMVSCTRTSDWKPCALPSWMPPSRAACSTLGAAGVPFSTTSRASTPRTSLMQLTAALVALSTALEVTVAPVMASMAPPVAVSICLNCSQRSVSSFHFMPKPAVSAKLVSPMTAPVTMPSSPTPRVTATGPA